MARRNPRTVLVVHPSAELYGSDRMLLESLLALRSHGWNVVVTVPLDGPLVRSIEALGIAVEILPVPVLRKTLFSARGVAEILVDTFRSFGRLLALLRRVRPELVYVNTMVVPLWVLAAAARRLRILCHVHEAEDDLPLAVRLAITAPLLLCRTVVANSVATSSTLIRAVPRLRRRLQVIYNGVPGPGADMDPPAAPAPRARLVLVGRLSPRKGSDLAITATELLARRGYDVELHLVGSIFPGYEWYDEQLRRATHAAGLGERLVRDGFLPDVWSSYELAHVVLVPSRAEPFGNVAVEAMLAGRPLVAARVQGLAEIVTDGVDGALFPPGDPRALADAVAALLDDWPHALRMAAAGRRTAQRRFGVGRYAAEFAAAAAATVR